MMSQPKTMDQSQFVKDGELIVASATAMATIIAAFRKVSGRNRRDRNREALRLAAREIMMETMNGEGAALRKWRRDTDADITRMSNHVNRIEESISELLGLMNRLLRERDSSPPKEV